MKDLVLLWAIAPGTYRGICYICHESLQEQAASLDWES